MRRFPILSCLSVIATIASAAPMERWVYLPANFQVDAETERVIALMKRAKAAGYTHALLADSKFARLGDVIPRYFTNAARVRDEAARLKLDLIPAAVAVFLLGFGADSIKNLLVPKEK